MVAVPPRRALLALGPALHPSCRPRCRMSALRMLGRGFPPPRVGGPVRAWVQIDGSQNQDFFALDCPITSTDKPQLCARCHACSQRWQTHHTGHVPHGARDASAGHYPCFAERVDHALRRHPLLHPVRMQCLQTRSRWVLVLRSCRRSPPKFCSGALKASHDSC